MNESDLMTDTRPKIIVFNHGISGSAEKGAGIFWFDIRTAPQFEDDGGRLVGEFTLTQLNEQAESRPLLAAIAEWQDRTGQTQWTEGGEELSWTVEEFFALL
jgi:hypothetical protein